MQTLIADLLALSRVGTKARPLEPGSADAILDDALHDLRFPIEDAGATVARDCLPAVMADRVQIAQLFRNLLSNALKFRSAAPPRIRVSARAEVGRVVISVSDSGIGIAPEHFDRIFVIFQRLHARDEYPGTGMGLAICKKIVERHGGRLWVDSRPGEGATFSFTLAAAPEAAVEGHIDAIAAAAVGGTNATEAAAANAAAPPPSQPPLR